MQKLNILTCKSYFEKFEIYLLVVDNEKTTWWEKGEICMGAEKKKFHAHHINVEYFEILLKK